jgi:hypothetical protein
MRLASINKHLGTYIYEQHQYLRTNQLWGFGRSKA